MIEALIQRNTPALAPLGHLMNNASAALTSTQRAWVTTFATAVTLLSVLVLGLLG